MVKYGDIGPEVAEVQKLLSLLGYDLIVDAHYGDKTLRSVKSFQKKYNLLQDGIVGEKTLATLKAAQKNLKPEIKTPVNIDYGDLVVNLECQMPEQQYVKQVTSKSQIFLHFTAGWPSAKNTISYWNADPVQVATAYVIDGDSGIPYQAFHPDYYGWHLGAKGTNGKLDRASIGIEICAFGPLEKKGDKFYAWPNNYSSIVIDPKNVYTLHKPFRGKLYYYAFTEKQLKNLEKLLIFLIEKYDIKVQENFDFEWLEYNQELLDKCLPGIWSHSNVRKDKFDVYPDFRLFEMLNRIAKKFN
jgi:N-acetyl-anhydromuramyl-L-alanine amidase AmpD